MRKDTTAYKAATLLLLIAVAAFVAYAFVPAPEAAKKVCQIAAVIAAPLAAIAAITTVEWRHENGTHKPIMEQNRDLGMVWAALMVTALAVASLLSGGLAIVAWGAAILFAFLVVVAGVWDLVTSQGTSGPPTTGRK